MRPSILRLKPVLAAAGLMLILTGCARTMATAGTDPACRVFEPIRYSRLDTEASQRQAREHNAAWKALCRK